MQDLSKIKSRSLEPLGSLAMWSDEPVLIELIKGDEGLGFSILDYQVRFVVDFDYLWIMSAVVEMGIN